MHLRTQATQDAAIGTTNKCVSKQRNAHKKKKNALYVNVPGRVAQATQEKKRPVGKEKIHLGGATTQLPDSGV